MNKTILIVIIAVVVVIGGYFLLANQNSPVANEPEGSMNESMGGEGANMENGSAEGGATEGGGEMMAGEVKTFNIVGTNFDFSQTEIRVNEGDTVRINFSVQEGFHDWVIDEFDARTQQMQAGGTQTIEFVADQAGTFEYYCSVGQHRQMGMVGTLIVE